MSRRPQSYFQFKGSWDQKSASSYEASRFSRTRRWRWTDRKERLRIQGFLSSLPPGSKVLDVPCGSGRFVPIFHGSGLIYFGVDASFPMLRLAKEKSGPTRYLAGSDVLYLPFHEGTFDAVICIRLLHRIREPQVRVSMLKEMARVCRGPLLASYYLRWNLRGLQRWARGKYPGVSCRTVRQDALKAGLHVQEIRPLNALTQQQCFFTLVKPDR